MGRPGAEAAQPRLAEYGADVTAAGAELLAQLVGEKSPAAVLIAGTTEGKEIASDLPAITATVSQIAQSAGLCGRY